MKNRTKWIASMAILVLVLALTVTAVGAAILSSSSFRIQRNTMSSAQAPGGVMSSASFNLEGAFGGMIGQIPGGGASSALCVGYICAGTKSDTTTTITLDNPDPSIVGQSVTVNFSVTSAASDPPPGDVTVSDGVDSCNATLAAGTGTCNIILTTIGARTLTATYAGNAYFNGSAGTAAHTVDYNKLFLPLIMR